MTQIVIVEDEPDITEVVSLYFSRAGFEVVSFTDGLDALEALTQHMPDLVILDVMLPRMDGFTLIRQLRDRSDVPIILLTSRQEETDRIAGLELGADDYVTKPFSPQELVSRVRAVLRRTRAMPGGSHEQLLKFGILSISPRTRVVMVGEKEASLTAKEFDMLYYMACHPRRVFTRDELLESVWGHSEYIDPGTVTVHIRRLREKIESDPANPVRLVTVWGVGYKFDP
jgi:two-component system, OmpR family, response regulator ResD